MLKKLARQNPIFKASEKEQQRAYIKQEARKKPGTLAKECAKQKLARLNPIFKASEKEQQHAYKQEARRKPGILAKECAKKASKTKSHFQSK